MRFRIFFVLCILSVLPFFSCKTLQDDRMSVAGGTDSHEIVLSFEKELAAADAAILRGDTSVRRGFADLRGRIRMALDAAGPDRLLAARLTALLGRTALLDGSRSEASRLSEAAAGLYAADVQALVLSARLERDLSARLRTLETLLQKTDERGPLILEQAIAASELKQYPQAVAFFDEAFLSLEPFYREAYGPLRDTAWQLRDVSSSADSIAIHLAASRLTYQGMVLICQSETGLLDFLTAAKTLSARELLRQLSGNGFLYDENPRAQAEVNRRQAAWFIWNLYVRKRGDPSLKKRYTARYTARGITSSPVPDVPLSDKAFDAVLGCVENELINLADGVMFYPDAPVSGADFLQWVKKADR